MFYYISKILGVFSFASNILILLGVAGLMLRRWPRTARLGNAFGILSVLGLVICGFTPLGNMLLTPLENRFPKPDPAAIGEIKDIIVLGGSLETHVSTQRGTPALTDAAERLTVVPELARRFPQARLIFTGGVGLLQDQFFRNETEAQAARTLWLSFGLPESRMLFEDKSRNTVENALFTRDLVKPKPGERYLLVTSAFHMPRSVALFRKAGFEVVPWPVDYRTGGFGDIARGFYSSSQGLSQTDLATREWIGLIGYRLTGKIDILFPAP